MKQQGDIWVVAKTLKAFNRLRVAWEEDYGNTTIPVEPPPARWADCSEADWVRDGGGLPRRGWRAAECGRSMIPRHGARPAVGGRWPRGSRGTRRVYPRAGPYGPMVALPRSPGNSPPPSGSSGYTHHRVRVCVAGFLPDEARVGTGFLCIGRAFLVRRGRRGGRSSDLSGLTAGRASLASNSLLRFRRQSTVKGAALRNFLEEVKQWPNLKHSQDLKHFLTTDRYPGVVLAAGPCRRRARVGGRGRSLLWRPTARRPRVLCSILSSASLGAGLCPHSLALLVWSVKQALWAVTRVGETSEEGQWRSPVFAGPIETVEPHRVFIQGLDEVASEQAHCRGPELRRVGQVGY